jgi:two-component system nitrogen regulation response regulator NtrX
MENAMKILIVDDNRSVRELLSEVVSMVSRFHVLVAETKARAIKVTKKEKPDIILLDIYLPDCQNLSTLKALRKITPNAMIIVISADNSCTETIVESIKLGAYDFMGKPFPIQHLINKLKKMLIILEQQKTIEELMELLRQNGKNVGIIKPRNHHPK